MASNNPQTTWDDLFELERWLESGCASPAPSEPAIPEYTSWPFDEPIERVLDLSTWEEVSG